MNLFRGPSGSPTMEVATRGYCPERDYSAARREGVFGFGTEVEGREGGGVERWK